MIIKTTLRTFSKVRLVNFFSFTDHKSEKYIERPWQRQTWLSLNKKCTIKDAIHGAWLMSSGVMPFSYDGYEWTCARAMQSQAQLHKQDLLMLMNLGVEYGVRLSPFSELIENEIFLRIHRDYEVYMQDYQQQVQQEIKSMYANLQSKSLDYYSLLREEGQENDIEEDEGEQEQKIIAPLIKDYGQGKTGEQEILLKLNQRISSKNQKQFELKDLIRSAQLLQRWNSKNITMIQYLQQLLTVKLQSSQIEAPLALAYLRFLIFACQSLMAEYNQNKQLYTPRSIKRIYKYQYFYFQEHFRHLIVSDSTSSPQFIQSVIQEYASFPIKRRQIRKKIGIYVSSQFKRFGMTHRLDLINTLIHINRKDEKMKRTYRALFGLPQPENQEKIQLQQHTNSDQIKISKAEQPEFVQK